MNTETLNNGDIILHASKDDLIELNELKDLYGNDFCCDDAMYEFMESFISNSELSFIAPEDIGALTSAPIIATHDQDDNVIDTYGFMDYAIESLQERLLCDGKALFTKG